MKEATTSFTQVVASRGRSDGLPWQSVLQLLLRGTQQRGHLRCLVWRRVGASRDGHRHHEVGERGGARHGPKRRGLQHGSLHRQGTQRVRRLALWNALRRLVMAGPSCSRCDRKWLAVERGFRPHWRSVIRFNCTRTEPTTLRSRSRCARFVRGETPSYSRRCSPELRRSFSASLRDLPARTQLTPHAPEHRGTLTTFLPCSARPSHGGR